MPRKTTRSITLKRKLDFTRLVDAVRQVCERSAAVARPHPARDSGDTVSRFRNVR
jgi:hypothetical protein